MQFCTIVRAAGLIAVLCAAGLAGHQSHAATYKVLHYFCLQLPCPAGANPTSIVVDSSGDLYGSAENGGGANRYGNVFRLTPPAPGSTEWTDTILYRFVCRNKKLLCPKGANPTNLILGPSDAIYGTTYNEDLSSVDEGTVFELSPPISGAPPWTKTVLSPSEVVPNAGLVMDLHGNLYGTASANSGNSIFELSPPLASGSQWTFQTIFNSFPNNSGVPIGNLIVDTVGNLYGVTGGIGSYGGSAYELSPPSAGQNQWTYKVLYNFCLLSSCRDGTHPAAGLAMDNSGSLFGTTEFGGANQEVENNNGGGTVFKLSPPEVGKTVWTEKILYSFCSKPNCADGVLPMTNLIFDVSGNLYGTTDAGGYDYFYGGTVFKLSSPVVGKTQWTETILHKFCYWSICLEGGSPVALTYTRAASGALYDGTSPLYGAATSEGHSEAGTVFELIP